LLRKAFSPQVARDLRLILKEVFLRCRGTKALINVLKISLKNCGRISVLKG